MKSISYVSLEHEILPREIFTKIRTGHLPASTAGTFYGPCHRRTCPVFIIFMVFFVRRLSVFIHARTHTHTRLFCNEWLMDLLKNWLENMRVRRQRSREKIWKVKTNKTIYIKKQMYSIKKFKTN